MTDGLPSQDPRSGHRISGARFGSRILAWLVVALLPSCADSERPGLLSTGSMADFCAAVLPRVEAFTSLAEREKPVPDDERYGGTVVVSSLADLTGGLNGFSSEDYVAVQHQQFVGLMTLLRYDEKLELQPYLAESWDVDPEAGVITFRLRDDVFWHDGERTDAYDVAFTYERVTDPRTAFSNVGFLDHYVGGSDGVQVLDSLTVSIRWARPHAEFMDVWRAIPIMPQHLLASVPPESLRQHPFGTVCPVGNGPFVFVEHRPGESWTFHANPSFPEALGGRPFVDRYVYRVVAEPATRLAELLTERSDVYFALPAEQVDRIDGAPGLSVRSFHARDYVLIAWNGRKGKLSDRRVRRALTTGIDREGIVAALMGGYGRVAQTSVPSYHWAYDPTLERAVVYDPVGAARLLEEAGWSDGDGDGIRESSAGERLSIELVYSRGSSQRTQMAEIIQSQLRSIGVDIELSMVDLATLIARVMDTEARDFEGALLGWANEFKLDDRDLFHSDRSEGANAFSGTSNPELDRLLDTLQTVINRDESVRLWSSYQRELIAEQPFTFIHFRQQLVGMNDRIRGAEMDVRGEWINLKEWWIDPTQR